MECYNMQGKSKNYLIWFHVRQLVKEILSLDTDIRKELDQKIKDIYFKDISNDNLSLDPLNMHYHTRITHSRSTQKIGNKLCVDVIHGHV